nr:tRNA 5-methylaminomethyl-2-thiouridine biosynthesis bifunctional protein MnmC [Klebsiella pneumoniae]
MIVAESGFGTGLNFLTLWQAFDVLFVITRTLPCKGYISSVLKISAEG